MPAELTPPEFHKRYPSLGTGAVSTDMYWKPEIFAKEVEAIFRPSWHYLGRIEQIQRPGDFFVRELRTFGISVLVVRGEDNEIRAFFNACIHRGNKLQVRTVGRRRTFTCKFHGWRYALDGRVDHIPDKEGFPGIDCKNIKLKQLNTAIWQGFIFVNINDQPEQTLEEYLGSQGGDLVGYPFEKGVTQFKIETEVNCNWKFLLDSFTESYHIAQLHNRSINGPMAGPDNPFGRAVDVRIKGLHRSFGTRGNLNFKPEPVQQLALNYSPSLSLTAAGGEADHKPKGVNPTDSPDWCMDVNVFFPNLLCTIGGGTYFTHQVWPLSANKTHWELTGYLRPATNAAHRFGQEHALVELRDVVLEDLNILERIQKNIETGLIPEFHFHDHEIALRYQNYTVEHKISGTTNEIAKANQ
ncbi:MAG: aromatic ring-hydroxylating dioxygenase subunit alpha [Halieaceae bacterium]|nr:aromatic ring-hydroxylating dioxygenase subunit alpha [Halieaceae bacterium]